MDVKQLLLVSSVLATGLMAGLFYGWSVSVIPGTRRLASTDYVALMQHVNREILTPRFLVPFVGIPLLLAAAALAQFRAGDQRRGVLLGASAVTNAIGVFAAVALTVVELLRERKWSIDDRSIRRVHHHRQGHCRYHIPGPHCRDR